MVLNHMVNRLRRNNYVFWCEFDLFADLWQQVVGSNRCLLSLVIALRLDPVHSVPENRIHLTFLIVTEDEQTTAKVEVQLREVLVMELRVLRCICEMGKDTSNLLTLGCITDFIKFVKVDDRVHTLALDQDIHNLAPSGALVSV